MALHRELEGEPLALLPLVLPRKEQIQPGYVGIDGRRREKCVALLCCVGCCVGCWVR